MEDQPNKRTLRIFLSYAHEDESLVQELETHLTPFVRRGVLLLRPNREVRANVVWLPEIYSQIAHSDIVLLFVSPDYLASTVSEGEIAQAIRTTNEKGTRLIPIILRPSAWQRTPLAKFQVLPGDGRAVSANRNRDEAWAEIARRLAGLIEDLTAPGDPHYAATAGTKLPLYEVFKPSGTPTVTFVEPPQFSALKLSLAQPGRGLVVEGPSGIGKTTALKRAQDALAKGPFQRDSPIEILSARRPDHVVRLANLPESHVGTVVADDFHRLPKGLRDSLADYLKFLADYEDSDKKLVIAGIPRIGERIVQLSFDLATRLDVFRLGRVEDELVFEMIQKGEKALNVRFSRTNEIVTAASGSLNIAQLLCFHLCALDGIDETQAKTRTLRATLEDAVARVMEQIEPKFGSTARVFSSLGGRRDLTTIEMLRELSRTRDGFLSLHQLHSDRPDLSDGIERFVRHRQVDRVYESVPDSRTFLLYDDDPPALVIDDPQLAFFLAQTPTSKWMRVSGKTEAPKRDQVFVSYSHRDTEWLERVRVHLKPLERDGSVKLWDDTKIRTGRKWREDIATAIDSAKVAVLLISANFLASDFVIEHELPPLLAAAEEDGAVICPVIVSPSRFLDTPSLAQFQSVNPPSSPLSAVDFNAQEEVLLRLAKTIELALSTEEDIGKRSN